MVSYYNSLAMFPQPSRPGSGPPGPASNPSLYSSYTHAAYNQYAQHDQNSNLQLYAGFSPEFGHGASAPWPQPPHSWSQFPGSCRNYTDWGGVDGPAHPPPTTTPTSEGGLHSPNSPSQPQFTTAGGRQESGSPSPSDYSVPPLSTQFKPSLSPSPSVPLLQHYKTEPGQPSSTTDLGLPSSSPSVSAGAPPNISIGSSLDDDCPPSPPLSSRPQPARSPFEWMKKPSHPSPPNSSDPNGKFSFFNKSILNSVKLQYESFT